MNQSLVQTLNEAIRIEHTLAMQCHQYSLTVSGLWRLSLAPFFGELGDEARAHARKFGMKVVALGGTPAAQVDEVRTSGTPEEMVADVLRLERRAMKIYRLALDQVAGDDVAMRTMLEDHIESEQRHVEDIERLVPQAASPSMRRAS